MAVSTIPMFMLWWNVEGILRTLGQGLFTTILGKLVLKRQRQTLRISRLCTCVGSHWGFQDTAET